MRLAPVLVALLPAAALAQAPAATSTSDRPTPRNVKPAATPAKAGDEKVICRTYPVIGSLVQTKRICARKREWDLGDALRRERGSGACGTPEAPSC